MFDWIQILAQRRNDDDDNVGKIIFGLLFFLFLGISALTSWMNKKKEEERRRRAREAIARGEAMGQTQRLETISPTAPRPVATRVQRQHQHARTEPRDERIRRLQQMAGARTAPVPAPVPLPPVSRATKPMPPKRPATAARRPVPPPPPRRVASTQPQVLAQATPAEQLRQAADPTVAHPVPAAAEAQQIARWLKPATLRSQFILTELLQPPVALRERREI